MLNPQTRQQWLAYYLALGQEPAHAARRAGYAKTSWAKNANRLAEGQKVQRLVEAYRRRLGIVDDLDTFSANVLYDQMEHPNPRISVPAIALARRLADQHSENPLRRTKR